MISAELAASLDLDSGSIAGAPVTTRYLSDLRGSFLDATAYEAERGKGNPVVYTVSSWERASGDGQLHYGLGVLMPGKIGDEYYMTRGHYHSWRPAAEVYIGLRGGGCMLLEDEATRETRMEPLGANQVVYVPGHTAHRTINTGTEPLVYVGVYPSAAGHDYGAIAERNFRMIVVEREGRPVLLERPQV
ncbi:MAG: glucose-6-phosphate isomerase family protein [Candidatus Sumerlaeaceae bacterium]